ncbi:hypothetical protein [Rubripirellula reticaptiva]|uniref:Uncharacterized protein n=1 Tax=Rubripirellula reticaptiva TaxID=2528013 RepID=A0A5C6EMD4_9BACT|nr:hypothetical protein [Rubripirellula reticaptiva]TWU49297.1 hypothetical protein Poly59_39110 [Rubripirellula reticaptiva]
MAWEVSITAEGWSEIREKLDDWNRENLIAAITDDKFEAVYEKGEIEHAKRAADAERSRIEELPNDVLADRAFELIEQNNTCDNGGFGYWIDREGFHKVWLE